MIEIRLILITISAKISMINTTVNAFFIFHNKNINNLHLNQQGNKIFPVSKEK